MASTETAKTEHADHGHAHHGDPSDPHYEEHHVVSWQLLTGVLFALFFRDRTSRPPAAAASAAVA